MSGSEKNKNDDDDLNMAIKMSLEKSNTKSDEPSDDDNLNTAIKMSMQGANDSTKIKQSIDESIEADDILLDNAIRSSLQKNKDNDNDNKKEIKVDEFVEHLWTMADQNIMPLIYSRCQININAKISDKDVSFIVDTGAQKNVMTMEHVKYLGLESYIDKSQKGKMVGVGSADIIGIIPYLEVKFGTLVCPMNFYVIDSKKDDNRTKDLDMLLGFPFMMFYKIKLDFSRSKMTIMNNEVNIIIKEF